jgi:hypothetical protein
MALTESEDDAASEHGEVEFFGVKLTVRNPRLAALLNSAVTDEVQVIGRRARDAFSVEEADELDVTDRVLHVDGSVTLQLDDTEDV